MTLCEGCILYGRCSGSCGDTDSTYGSFQEENDAAEYLAEIRHQWHADLVNLMAQEDYDDELWREEEDRTYDDYDMNYYAIRELEDANCF